MKGLAAGSGFFAGTLVNAARGVVGQNFFTYQPARLFSSHAPHVLGGAPSGAWQWFAFGTKWCVGETVELDLEITDELKGTDGLGAGRAASAFRIKAAGHHTYVLFNLDGTRDQRLVVPKPARIGGPVTRWEMAGDVTTSNATLATKDDMSLSSTPEPDGFGQTAIEALIGAGKCVAWVFHGDVRT